MYKVSIKSKGKYGNWTLGDRYYLFTKDAIKFIALAISEECEIEYFKFVRLYSFAYCWSSAELNLNDKFLKKLKYELLNIESEE